MSIRNKKVRTDTLKKKYTLDEFLRQRDRKMGM